MQCPAKRERLVHYPTTTAPGIATTQCADNAHVKNGFNLIVRCSSNGSWSGTTPQCECDDGYHAVTVSGRQICQSKHLVSTIFHMTYSVFYRC